MPTPKAQALPYRAGVGIMLLNAQKQVFTAKRIDMIADAWQMPQGGIDEGEDPTACALRELGEETGIPPHCVRIIGQSRDWLQYDLPDDLIDKIWKGRYRGQRQLWFAMQLTADDSVINIHTDNPEFSEWKWAKMQELPNLIVPFKRALYEQIIAEFAHLA